VRLETEKTALHWSIKNIFSLYFQLHSLQSPTSSFKVLLAKSPIETLSLASDWHLFQLELALASRLFYLETRFYYPDLNFRKKTSIQASLLSASSNAQFPISILSNSSLIIRPHFESRFESPTLPILPISHLSFSTLKARQSHRFWPHFHAFYRPFRLNNPPRIAKSAIIACQSKSKWIHWPQACQTSSRMDLELFSSQRVKVAPNTWSGRPSASFSLSSRLIFE